MAKFFWNYLNIKPQWYPGRLTPLEEALEWQEWFLGLKKDNIEEFNFFIFAEHEPVYIYPPKIEGSISDDAECKKYLRVHRAELRAPLFQSPKNYGGTITYYGPGILVCYLIVDVAKAGCEKQDILRVIEGAVKEILKKLFDIESYTLPELHNKDDAVIEELLHEQGASNEKAARGIWVVHNGIPKRIMSHGVYYTGNISTFGFALNVFPDLSYFDSIYPCGLNIKMTSIEQLAGKRPRLVIVAKALAEALIRKFKEISGNDEHQLI